MKSKAILIIYFESPAARIVFVISVPIGSEALEWIRVLPIKTHKAKGCETIFEDEEGD